MKNSIFRSKLFFILGIISIAGVWKILSLVMQSGIIFPPPEQVLAIFIRKLPTADFLKNVGVSAIRVSEGFLLSFAAGSVTGIICG